MDGQAKGLTGNIVALAITLVVMFFYCLFHFKGVETGSGRKTIGEDLKQNLTMENEMPTAQLS